MNLRAAANAVSTSSVSSAGGCESSNSGLCDIAMRASVMVISKVNGGGEGLGDGGGVLGERGGGDVPVGADDDETDGVGIEPGLQSPGGVTDDRDLGGFPWVTGRCGVPVQLGGRADT